MEGSRFVNPRDGDDSLGISMPKFCKVLPLCEEFLSKGDSLSFEFFVFVQAENLRGYPF